MDSKIVGDQQYDNHYTYDRKKVHFTRLPFPGDDARFARTLLIRRHQIDSVIPPSVTRLDEKQSKSESVLSPPPISPIAASSEEQKKYKNN